MMARPTPGDYAPFYGNYIALVNDGPVLKMLDSLKTSTYKLFCSLTDEQADYAYDKGKWTVKEVAGHLIDAERTFAYRVLAFSRGQAELPGFDENIYVERSNFNNRSLPDLAAEFKTTREANLYMLRALTEEQLAATGIANGSKISVNAIIYIMAGHELHHLNILKERYLIWG
ncbi:DinB family protein [Mucilaginibacter sp. UR6-11]|uniref:DinB family protein n=1 Tax=Mucilaginibacter sp. UR6-11 TaxID=1435644 RepID=UPI001E51F8E2|nr:DinB family protein [Mucilaginibacter sp. UR6-11]MCC8427281.1 DinB family protein [Mucilaginibacter sp. UR6-11]